jgi:hypothetical protein
MNNNIFVENLKNTVSEFYGKVMQAKAQMEQNKNRFLPETVEAENKLIWGKIETEYTRIYNELVDEFVTIREALSVSIVPTTENESVEVKYFNNEYPIEVTAQLFVAFSDRHRRNYLWQGFLLEQINKKSDTEKQEFNVPRILIESRTARAVLKTYAKIYTSAINLVDKIFYNSDSAVLELDIEYFLTETKGFSTVDFETVGDGSEIKDYIKLAEKAVETEKSLLNDIELKTNTYTQTVQA